MALESESWLKKRPIPNGVFAMMTNLRSLRLPPQGHPTVLPLLSTGRFPHLTSLDLTGSVPAVSHVADLAGECVAIMQAMRTSVTSLALPGARMIAQQDINVPHNSTHTSTLVTDLTCSVWFGGGAL